MRTKLTGLWLTLSWMLSAPSVAEQTTRLTLQQCIAIALEKNPLVLSSAQHYQASLARIRRAKAFPQPVFGYDSDLQPGFFNFKDSGESYVGLSFGIDFPTKRTVRGEIATKESQQVSVAGERLKLDLALRVKEAFYGLLLAQEKLAYAENNLGLARDFLEKTELKYEAGEVARVEPLRARVEASRALNEVRSSTNDVRVAQAVLNFYIARPEREPIEVEGELKTPPFELDLESLKRTALTYRPEVKAIQLSLEAEELRKKQAYQAYLPDIGLGISRHRLEGQPTTWDVTLAVPVPLFFWQPRSGEIAEAKANLEALKREEDHVENSITLEVEGAYREAVTASNQIQLFETEILTQAEEVYNMFLFSYQEGEIGAIELIEARRTLMEARKSYADALHGYATAIAAVEKAIGRGL